MAWKGWSLVLAGLVAVVAWPSVHWYVARMVDGSDEPWGVVALLAAVALTLYRGVPRVGVGRLVVASGDLALLAATRGVMTPLIQGVLVAVALASLLVVRRSWVGHGGLFLLSLPLISSLQFYGGYPLRWLIGQVVSRFLSLLGFAVEAEGAVLHWRGEMVAIDAPCSGVQMLWASWFFACLLGCIRGLDARRSVLLLQVAGVCAFLGNVVRNVLLFFVESGLMRLGAWAHETVGAVVFCGTLGGIAWVGLRLKEGERVAETRATFPAWGRPVWVVGGVFACCLAWVVASHGGAAERLIDGAGASREDVDTVLGAFEEEGWRRVELDAVSQRYAERFPGAIALFARGGETMVARVIERATRRYHPSADCYRAMGYSVEAMPLARELDGTLWGRSLAVRKGERVEVRERVVSQDGQAWTDPSSWFWSAFFGKSEGPWIGVSIAKSEI